MRNSSRPLQLALLLGALLGVAGCGSGTELVERPILDSGHSDHSSADSLTFLVFGDSGTGEPEQHKVASGMRRICEAEGCDFALGLGDNIYDEGVVSVRDAVLDDGFELPY